MANNVYWTTITDPDGTKKSGFIQDGKTYYAEGGAIKSGASVTDASGKTWTKGGSATSGSGVTQSATGQTLPGGGVWSRDDQGTNWYTVGNQSYNMSAPNTDFYKAQAQSNFYLDELRKAQQAAEEAQRLKTENNIKLIEQQMQTLGKQTADQKSDIYTTSRISALQNAEKQAALGLGGGVYEDAPSGYAESVRLRQDSELKNSLNAADQAKLDAQRALENMKINAATMGEADLNSVTSEWAQAIAAAKQQQAQQEQDNMWKVYEALQNQEAIEREKTQQAWENQYKQSALDADIKASELSQAMDRAKIEYNIYGKLVSPDLITLFGGEYAPISTRSSSSIGASSNAPVGSYPRGANSAGAALAAGQYAANGAANGLNLLTNAAATMEPQAENAIQKRIDYLVSQGLTDENQIKQLLANWNWYANIAGLSF